MARAETRARYLALSFAAWIGSLPLSAKYFHLFSPVSTLANLFAVPLGMLALLANLGALLCGHWFPLYTELFKHAAWFFMVAMSWISEVFTKIPGAYSYVPEPSLATIAIFYAIVIVICSGCLNSLRRIIPVAAILIFIATIYFWQWGKSRAATDLTGLPLNGGHAVFVDADGRANDWLINCGNESAVNFTLRNFLHAQGVNKIPRLVLTEGDTRNTGGALALENLFGIDELWTSSVKFRSANCREAVTAFDKPPRRQKLFQGGSSVGCWQVLHPGPEDSFSRADHDALVFAERFASTRLLLLSDLSRTGKEALLENTNDLRADIVSAGLPTEGEPLCDALLDAIQPKVIVIADSEFPATRRASRELHERLEPRKIPVLYMRTARAVKIITQPGDWKLQTMDGQKFSAP